MSIVFDEIVGTVTDSQPNRPEPEREEKKRQRPLPLTTLRRINAHQQRQKRLQQRLLAD